MLQCATIHPSQREGQQWANRQHFLAQPVVPTFLNHVLDTLFQHNEKYFGMQIKSGPGQQISRPDCHLNQHIFSKFWSKGDATCQLNSVTSVQTCQKNTYDVSVSDLSPGLLLFRFLILRAWQNKTMKKWNCSISNACFDLVKCPSTCWTGELVTNGWPANHKNITLMARMQIHQANRYYTQSVNFHNEWVLFVLTYCVNGGANQHPCVVWTTVFWTFPLHYTLHTTHYTLHTTHYTLHTTHYTLHTTHYTLHTTHYTLHTHTLHTTHYTLHTTHYTLHITHHTLHTTHYTLHTTHYTLHTTHYTLHPTRYTLHITLHTTHYTLHTTHYTLHTTHYTLHTTHYTLHTILYSTCFTEN